MLGLDFRRLLVERAYRVAGKGEKVQLCYTVQGCFEGEMGQKDAVYLLREVDCMGVAYLEDSEGKIFSVPYEDGLYKKYEEDV